MKARIVGIQYEIRKNRKVSTLQELSVSPEDRSEHTNELRLPFNRETLQMWSHQGSDWPSQVPRRLLEWRFEGWIETSKIKLIGWTKSHSRQKNTWKTIKKEVKIRSLWKWEFYENKKFHVPGTSSKRKNNGKWGRYQQWMIGFWS